MRSLIIAFLLTGLVARAQRRPVNFHIESAHTSFPDTARANGHLYNSVLYDAPGHYSSNTVLIMVPPNFDRRKKPDLIFWFHGWRNNIDSAVVRYDLQRQFADAHLNAVLVLAETAKDAPDSYGGKLERPGEFSGLVQDVIAKLKNEKILRKNDGAGNILLAGHSGAYRVMAYILQYGNVPVQKVILFDALYGETDKYINWIKQDTNHRFINLYTDNGGTDKESKEMIKKLGSEGITCYSLEEIALTKTILQQSRILVVHSTHKHDDIIKHPDNFLLFLQAGQ